MYKFNCFVLLLVSVSLFFCVRNSKVWMETSQKDFADGRFDGGGNLYASWNGDVRVVNGWDLNEDGNLDIVFSNYSSDTSYNIHSDIYWGSRTGFDLKRVTKLPSHACIAYAISDLNYDGIQDLVFSSWQNKHHDMDEYGKDRNKRFFDSFSLIYWGSKSGYKKNRFLEIDTYAPTGISTADLNNDGYLDLLFASSKEGETTVFWGGSELYSKKNSTNLPSPRSMVAYVADLNMDGILDIICANLAVESMSTVLFGSQGGYSKERSQQLPTSWVRSVAVADLNKDHHLDVVFANGRDKNSFATYSTIYWGSASGYSPENNTPLPTHLAMQAAVADMNLDGFLDIVFANCGQGKSFDTMEFDINSYIYLGSQEGFTSSKRLEIPTCGAHSVAIADFDDNGELDLLFSSLGDPEGKTVNYHAFLYFQNKGRFISSDLKFPNHNGHHNTNRDLGNIYSREYKDTYISSLYDAKQRVSWEKVEWKADIPAGCDIKVFIKLFDRNISNTDWIEANNGEKIREKQKYQFCQYKVQFSYDGKGRPVFKEIRIHHY